MAGQRLDRPVRVSDNGVRSFIPPTFRFDLREDDGTLVATVSQVVLAEPSLLDDELVEVFTREQLRATGTITDYDAGPEAHTTGKRLTIDRVIDADGRDWPG